MNKLKRVEVIGGEFRAYWDIVDVLESGREILTGQRMVQARTGSSVDGIGVEQFITLAPAMAAAVLTAEDEARANASAAAEAARLAELERWNSLTPEEQAAEIAANTPPPPVPEQITPRQLRLWLVTHGVSLSAIEAAMPNEAARIEWEYANYFERSNPLVGQVGSLLGLNVDQVFREAALL